MFLKDVDEVILPHFSENGAGKAFIILVIVAGDAVNPFALKNDILMQLLPLIKIPQSVDNNGSPNLNDGRSVFSQT